VAAVTTYLIAEVAERSGFTPPTLRYYETIGLLPPPERGHNGYRVYGEATLERLGFINRAKQLGCSLEEIAELVRAWEDGHCAPVQQRLLAVIDDKVREAQARIAELMALSSDLRRVAAGLLTHTPDGPCDDSCGCVSTPETGSDPAPVTLTSKPTSTGGDAATRAPIACTLGPGGVAGRLEEWRAVLAGPDEASTGVVARVAIEDGLRLEFGPGSDVLEIARLAAAEQDCCRFFSFSIVIDERRTALEVRAPADGQDALAALFGAAG
jgi:MerR family copper efflux transcriptional regulator